MLPPTSRVQVEQADLIRYGLIPEFVGRFPVVSTLQVGRAAHPSGTAWQPWAAGWSTRWSMTSQLWLVQLAGKQHGCCWTKRWPACCASVPTRIHMITNRALPRCHQSKKALSEEELAHVLCEPKNALIKQYAGIFSKNGCK